MPPVAVATDSTHYLPRALADAEGIHQVSLYVGWKGEPERELGMADFDAFYGGWAGTRNFRPPPSPRSATFSPPGSP